MTPHHPSGDPVTQAALGSGAGLLALVTSEVVTGWAQAASAVVGALILVVTLANGVIRLRRDSKDDIGKNT